MKVQWQVKSEKNLPIVPQPISPSAQVEIPALLEGKAYK
jgi:hypothetical protein